MKKRCLVLRIIYELQDLSNCIFFRDLTRLVKKSLQLDKEKKILYFYPHLFLQISIWSVFLRIFNPSTLIFLISIPWTTEKLKWQFEHTNISANSSTVIFWEWINHPVPALILDLSSPIPILDLPYYSSFSSIIFLMLLSSPCSHNSQNNMLSRVSWPACADFSLSATWL